MGIETKISKTLNPFSRFAKADTQAKSLKNTSKTVVAYTRVSGKEQEKNMSLPYQRQIIDEYAIREGLHIDAYFGGKYESAKSDGRKEFQRMLDFIKKSKGTISQILVYTVDRFSRTGGGAIKLAQELRDNYGVSLNAISQPTDVTNPTGVFQQNIQFLFSNYDNVLRKQRAIAGMRYKLERGIWISRPPQGYDLISINGVKSMKINERGPLIKKAFQWKAEGVKSEEILLRLEALGMPYYKQQLSKNFKNPFYCGYISHGLLAGQIVKGNHEPLISEKLFLKVNQIQVAGGLIGVPHLKENNNLPLKVFVKCDKCSQPMTGYIVKKRNLYYYKCRTNGCKCNVRNIKVHDAFHDLLSQFEIKQELQEPLKYQLKLTFNELIIEQKNNEQILKSKLVEIDKKIDTIEEKYFALNEMEAETFKKFNVRFTQEKSLIVSELERNASGSSNFDQGIKYAIEICSKLTSIWDLATISIREKLQKLLFPDGLFYIRENGTFRTETVHPVFQLISQLTGNYTTKEKGQTHNKLDSSLLAETERFELSIQLPIYKLSRLAP